MDEPIKYVYKDGTIEWKLPDGTLHRTDGPAVIRSDGYEAWYQNGKLHRTDGPAITYSNGIYDWYLNDNLISESVFTSEEKTLSEKVEDWKVYCVING